MIFIKEQHHSDTAIEIIAMKIIKAYDLIDLNTGHDWSYQFAMIDKLLDDKSRFETMLKFIYCKSIFKVAKIHKIESINDDFIDFMRDVWLYIANKGRLMELETPCDEINDWFNNMNIHKFNFYIHDYCSHDKDGSYERYKINQDFTSYLKSLK